MANVCLGSGAAGQSRVYRRESYRLEGERWMLVETYEGDEVVRAEPFDAIALGLADLWAG